VAPSSSGGRERRRRGPAERRSNVVLRELLDEMIQLTRHLSQHAPTMSRRELAYARARLEWLADEIWSETIGEPREQPSD